MKKLEFGGDSMFGDIPSPTPPPPPPTNNQPPEHEETEPQDNVGEEEYVNFDSEDDNTPYNTEEEYEGYEEGEDYEQPYNQQQNVTSSYLGVGIKFAGILALILIVFLGYRVFQGWRDGNRNEIESIVKMNPTGSVGEGYTESHNNPSTGNGNISAPLEPTTDNEFNVDARSIVTDIMVYSKKLSTDERPVLEVQNEKYGEYEIYIPHYIYSELDSNGYMLIDMEIVNDEVTFLYISEKQDNLNDLLNN